ncbi:MAG: trehalose-phosphatase, partial [Planctomycetota bacterium]
ARTPVLLVASDYDGTLSPIVDNPADAEPLREAEVALNNLCALPQTHVAVISGRALEDLAKLTNLNNAVHLVGSHGSEFELGMFRRMSDDKRKLRELVAEELHALAGEHGAFRVEEKPASVAFHYRNVPDAVATEVVRRVMEGPAAQDGVNVKKGKMVVELGVVDTHKGTALQALRHRVGATAAIFLGDDVTDEDVFVRLTGPDVGVKVGDGESAAEFRVESPAEVAELLARICEERIRWLHGAGATPIEEHALLSDQRTSAMVTPTGRITWLCVPRVDSPALFSELLGGPPDGHFTVRAKDADKPALQRYRSQSMVLETVWPDGMTVTDFLDCSAGRVDQRAGRCDLIRIIKGTGTAIIEFAPRLDFGRTPTRLRRKDGGLEVEDTLDPIVLRSPGVEWEIHTEGVHEIATAEVRLGADPLELELRYGTGSLREGAKRPSERMSLTNRYWQSWTSGLTLPQKAEELVQRSALVLKALCYGPSGAIAAAATTSLPETIGGVRNWDYRFCWLRDAAMSASSLVKLGSQTEAMAYLDWVLDVLETCSAPGRLQPLYSVTGTEHHVEAEIPELGGYRGSRPVRIGNAASRQIQLDVFGPIVDLVAQLGEREAPLSTHHWRLVEAMVEAVSSRWMEPDHGIWEIRKPRRHHVHSKVMCWMTVDRAIRVAKAILDRERDDWVQLRDEIASDVLENGWKENVGSFTAAYDGDDLDAAALCVGLSGLLEPTDDRFVRTVEAIETHLRKGPTVYRYIADDGLPGKEGGFHLCAAWLIHAYWLVGRKEDARRMFDDMIALVGTTGLLSEQYEPDLELALGNHPQAYSHIGLIENAVLMDE